MQLCKGISVYVVYIEVCISDILQFESLIHRGVEDREKESFISALQMEKWSTLKFEHGLESAEKVCFSLPFWVGMMSA